MTSRFAALGVLLALAIAAPVALMWPGRAPAHQVTRAQIVSFERVIDPLVSSGGQVIEDGMKPAVTDLSRDHVTPPAFIATEADGWTATLIGVRRSIAAAHVATGLTPARRTLVASLDLYIAAARTFKAAALASGAQREALITRGIDQAKQADTTFDQAAVVIQTDRRRLGLGPSAHFPDPGHG